MREKIDIEIIIQENENNIFALWQFLLIFQGQERRSGRKTRIYAIFKKIDTASFII